MKLPPESKKNGRTSELARHSSTNGDVHAIRDVLTSSGDQTASSPNGSGDARKAEVVQAANSTNKSRSRDDAKKSSLRSSSLKKKESQKEKRKKEKRQSGSSLKSADSQDHGNARLSSKISPKKDAHRSKESLRKRDSTSSVTAHSPPSSPEQQPSHLDHSKVELVWKVPHATADKSTHESAKRASKRVSHLQKSKRTDAGPVKDNRLEQGRRASFGKKSKKTVTIEVPETQVS